MKTILHPKSVIFFIGLTCFFIGKTPIYGQLDNSTRTSSGGSFGSSLNMSNNSMSRDAPSLSKTDKGMRSSSDKSYLSPKKEELDITDNEGFIEPNKKFDPKYLKKQGKERKMSDKYKQNQSFGELKNNGKFVKIVCRDHQAIDGDRVRVYVDGKVYVENILLEGRYKEVHVDLKKGFNKIEVEALNQGESGPNTAEFKVLNDQGKIISSNEWNLATGYKASMVVVKDK